MNAARARMAVLVETLRPLRMVGAISLLLWMPIVGAVAWYGSAALAAKTAALLAVAALCLLWWMAFVRLLMQNHPTVARLVPGQLRRLREVAAALLVGVALPCGTVLWWISGGSWLIWTLLCMFALLVIAVTARAPWIWVVCWMAPTFYRLWSETALWQAVLEGLRAGHADRPLLQATGLMLIMMLALCGLFSSGGAAHQRRWAGEQEMRLSLKDPALGAGAMTRLMARWPVLRWVAVPFCWLRTLWRRRLLATARPTATSALARAELVTLQGSHWTMVVGPTLLLLLLVAVVATAIATTAGADVGRALRNALGGMSIGLMGLLMSPAFGGSAAVQYKRRREQALLLLLPGMPRGDDLNRRLARRAMAQHVLCWALAVSVMLAVQWLLPSGKGGRVMLSWGLSYAAVCLPLGLLLWRDWSRHGVQRGAWTALLALGVIVTIAAVGWLVQNSVERAWIALAVSAVVTVVLMVWRWPFLRHSRTFWPVGRWAT